MSTFQSRTLVLDPYDDGKLQTWVQRGGDFPLDCLLLVVALCAVSLGFGWGIDEGGTWAMWRSERFLPMSDDWLTRWGPR